MTYQSFYVDLTVRDDDGRLQAIWRDPSRFVSHGESARFTSGHPLWLIQAEQWNLPGFGQLPDRFLDPTDESVDDQGEANATELIGLVLFEMVLPGGKAQREWIQRFEVARAEGGVRLRLNLAPDLEPLPWELLRAGARWKHAERGFLALDDRFSIVRSGKPVGQKDREPVETGVTRNEELPLRLLIVDAGRSALTDESNKSYPQLTTDARTAVDRLELRDPSLVAASLDHETVTADELARGLRSGGGANVFHFTGHGDEAAGKPPWLIVAASRPFGAEQTVDAVRLSADELGENLRRAGIEVAVLAACHAGTGAWWSGFGASLLAKGVPAIVSMQAMLENNAGDIFCSELYRNLADGAELDLAVSVARRRVFDKSRYKDWWLPLLHTRLEPLRFRPSVRPATPTLRHQSQSDQAEIPVGEERWVLRPGTWDHVAALSPDGNVLAFATGEGLALREVEGKVNVWLRDASDLNPIAVSPINENGCVRVLSASARTIDLLVDLGRKKHFEVASVDRVARCGAWIEDRFVWSDSTGEVHDAGDLPIEGCTHISSAVGPEGTLTAWIDAASTMTLHRATGADRELIPGVRPLDVGSIAEIVVAPAPVIPERVWIRDGLVWRGWTWTQLKEGVS